MAITPDPDRIHFDEIVKEYKDAALHGEETIWNRADLALEAATNYGGLKTFSAATGEKYQTLKNLSSVARAFEKYRRRYHLSFTHHAAIASRADREALLDKAEEEHWSVARLRQEVRPPAVPRPKPELVVEDEIEQLIAALNWAQSRGLIEKVVLNAETGLFEKR